MRADQAQLQTDPADPVPPPAATAAEAGSMIAPAGPDAMERPQGVHVLGPAGGSLLEAPFAPQGGIQAVSRQKVEAPNPRLVEMRSPVADQANASVQSFATEHFNAPRARTASLLATFVIACIFAGLTVLAIRRQSRRRALQSLDRFIAADVRDDELAAHPMLPAKRAADKAVQLLADARLLLADMAARTRTTCAGLAGKASRLRQHVGGRRAAQRPASAATERAAKA